MSIKIEKKKKTTKYKDIKEGNCFIAGGTLYMKTIESNKAIDLELGAISLFEYDEDVEEVYNVEIKYEM